jgi:Fur family transcriptional regulator, peroxide stress response regulator
MAPQKRIARLRDAGVNPTMQRLAILEYLEGTKAHPTADEIYAAVREKYPTMARATVYNTLEALTTSGTILKLTVDPAAARYDADTGPHVHFRCRSCGKVYDLDAKESRCLGSEVGGHHVESVRTYAFGVCASCHRELSPASSALNRSAKATPRNDPKGRSPNASVARKGSGERKAAAPRHAGRQEARTASASDTIRLPKGESPNARVA